MIARNVAIGLFACWVSFSALAQRSLESLVSEAGADWMFGQWQGTWEMGEYITLSLSWDLEKHVAVLQWKGPDWEFKGYTVIEPKSEMPKYYGFDSRGSVDKGSWRMEGGELVLRVESESATQGSSKLGIIFTGSASEGLKLRFHAIDSSGGLVTPAWDTRKFKMTEASLLAKSRLAQPPPATNSAPGSSVAVPATEQTHTTEVVDVAKVLASVIESAKNIPSLFLSQRQRVESVEAFVKIVGIKSPSEEEGALREELRRMLGSLNAEELNCTPAGTNAPLNLVMEFPATRDFRDQPAVILNAHIDTISAQRGYAPEQMDFEVQTREFFHRKEGSFGADDKAGVAVIVSALRKVKSDYWDKGVGHRRVLVIFTAHEEGGCIGATYLAERYPELFEKVEIALTCDGPINDTPSLYPDNSFVVVVDEQTSNALPYRKIVEYVRDLCGLKKATFAKTRYGLGQGDFAHFPPQAHADLHVRSPYQNNHRRERVKLDDLFNHIELFTYILLRLDGTSVQLDQR